MIPPIYGNDPVLALIRTMRERDRIPHAALFFGEKGMGRKTLARYFAMTALCTGEHAPCGECPSCRKILQDDLDEVHPHPDVIWVEHSGKKLGFSVDTVRRICKDAIDLALDPFHAVQRDLLRIVIYRGDELSPLAVSFFSFFV